MRGWYPCVLLRDGCPQVLHSLLDCSQGTEGQLSSVTSASANDVDAEDGSTTESGGGDSDTGPSNGTGTKPGAQRSRLGPRDTQPTRSQPRSSQSAVASTPCQLHSLLCAYYLACGLVGRCAELVSLMDQPRTGSLTRPIPDHVIQVRRRGAMCAFCCEVRWQKLATHAQLLTLCVAANPVLRNLHVGAQGLCLLQSMTTRPGVALELQADRR